MDTQDVTQQLRDAEREHRQARAWFHFLCRQTCYGAIDRAKFARALAAYVTAERVLQEAQAAALLAQGQPATWPADDDTYERDMALVPAGLPAAPPAEASAEQAVSSAPSPRLRFARYLVETGRLSEW